MNTDTARKMVGQIANKRMHEDGLGFYVCEVTCPHCANVRRVAFAGWSAIACRCGTDVYRSEAAMKGATP